jgi:hypothetical protein
MRSYAIIDRIAGRRNPLVVSQGLPRAAVRLDPSHRGRRFS